MQHGGRRIRGGRAVHALGMLIAGADIMQDSCAFGEASERVVAADYDDRAWPFATSSCRRQTAYRASRRTLRSCRPIWRLRNASSQSSVSRYVDGTTYRSRAGLLVMKVKSKVFVDCRSPVCRFTVLALTLTWVNVSTSSLYAATDREAAMALLDRRKGDGRVEAEQRTDLDRLDEREVVERDELDETLREQTGRREGLLVLPRSATPTARRRTARRMI